MHLTPGRRLLVIALALVALLVTASAASPAGRIVIRGAESGTHLTLSMSGTAVVVSGYLAPGSQAGCRVTRPRVQAVCSTADVNAIEVDTGPNPDRVEVLERMPVPVTVHLGAGSDKFIGSGERDTCYPEATKRNRCIGGGGNDLCIAGPKNTDCVGGPGNDTCIESTGSDGCWGDAGNDLCEMGPGEDGCHGGPGNDRLFGGPGADQLYGGPGLDYCDGGPGVGRSHGCEAGPRH